MSGGRESAEVRREILFEMSSWIMYVGYKPLRTGFLTIVRKDSSEEC